MEEPPERPPCEQRAERVRKGRCNRLRVLCIHGHLQSAAIFERKSHTFQYLFKDLDLDFIDAPHAIPGGRTEGEQGKPEPAYEWWPIVDDFMHQTEFDGIAESIDLVKKRIGDEAAAGRPYDGLLGFSQGGTLVAILCRLMTETSFYPAFSTPFPMLQFGIIVSAFTPPAEPWRRLFSDDWGIPTPIPTLHCWGTADAMVPPSLSRALCATFGPSASFVEHLKAHVLPTTSAAKKGVRAFLTKMLEESREWRDGRGPASRAAEIQVLGEATLDTHSTGRVEYDER